MQDIEFKLKREELHLSQTELSELWGVSLRTLQRWERGDFKIPEERAQQITQMLDDVNNTVISFFEKLKTVEKDNAIILLAYNQWNYDGDFEHYKIHYSCLAKCQDCAKKLGYNVRIDKFKPDEYADWLAGREDNQVMRSQWASLQLI